MRFSWVRISSFHEDYLGNCPAVTVVAAQEEERDRESGAWELSVARRLARSLRVAGEPQICNPAGRLLFCGDTRPGSMHDLTQARTASLVDLLLHAHLRGRSSPTPARQSRSTMTEVATTGDNVPLA